MPEVPDSGEGNGGWDAPRGALCHYVRIENGKIGSFAAVPASNWNFSPRDDKGVRGPVEEALVGAAGGGRRPAAGDPATGPHLRPLNGVCGSRD